MPQRHCGFGPLTFIAGADRSTLIVVHQRQIDGGGHRALSKLDGGTHVNDGRFRAQNRAVIRPIIHGEILLI